MTKILTKFLKIVSIHKISIFYCTETLWNRDTEVNPLWKLNWQDFPPQKPHRKVQYWKISKIELIKYWFVKLKTPNKTWTTEAKQYLEVDFNCQDPQSSSGKTSDQSLTKTSEILWGLWNLKLFYYRQFFIQHFISRAKQIIKIRAMAILKAHDLGYLVKQ